ncbi:MAG: hypothetical protein OEV81_09655 [Betaproteobacteria bacterium]|nr:hypothetical protein [Betaproteobacteria bacterium]MDH5222073.1 hypothetical protein [Betaproteobacteria bacterium]MDH5351646.1 hypothetical protein [Betaproteobacteria bacterium]
MEAEPILGVYAQLAVFIVGLSGIIGVVGRGANDSWIAADYLRFRTMIASGFVLLFQSILPIILLHFALSPRAVWGWSSAVMALIVCSQQVWRYSNYSRSRVDPKYNVFTWWLGTALQVSASVVLILNAAGIGFNGTFAPYLLAMSLVLALSCLAFIRLLSMSLPRG